MACGALRLKDLSEFHVQEERVLNWPAGDGEPSGHLAERALIQRLVGTGESSQIFIPACKKKKTKFHLLESLEKNSTHPSINCI